nr:hypothetical protein [uncultured Carboxylicivirga sp.]
MSTKTYIYKRILCIGTILLYFNTIKSQQDSIISISPQQYPGLGKAASGIFFSEKPWSVSGFGELNGVGYNYSPPKSELGDLELYYTSLYRLATFFGYRFTDKFIFNSEIQVEYLTDGNEGHAELNFELFFDYRFNKAFNMRAGFQPISIGYINSNDEPLLFYSVNRPEVERIIIPTTWIELGIGAYGQITPKLNYFINVVTGLDGKDFTSSTWIRSGRDAFDFRSLGISPQLIYTPINNLDLSVSGYFGYNKPNSYTLNGNNYDVNSKISVYSGYLRYNPKNFRFLMVGTYGKLTDTEGIYHLTKDVNGNGQVLGEEVYGGYFEAGVDILHWLWPQRNGNHKKLYNTKEMKLPLFIRAEHLNTHGKVAESLNNFDRVQSYLNILAVGMNFNLSQHIVTKVNYQIRKDLTPDQFKMESGNIIEFGLGFEF